MQFAKDPGASQVKALIKRGAAVLSYVPDYALSVAAPDGLSFARLGIQWVGHLQPEEKISPDLNAMLSSSPSAVLVEFYSDVSGGHARSVANEASVRDSRQSGFASESSIGARHEGSGRRAGWLGPSFVYFSGVCRIWFRACRSMLVSEH